MSEQTICAICGQPVASKLTVAVRVRDVPAQICMTCDRAYRRWAVPA